MSKDKLTEESQKIRITNFRFKRTDASCLSVCGEENATKGVKGDYGVRVGGLIHLSIIPTKCSVQGRNDLFRIKRWNSPVFSLFLHQFLVPLPFLLLLTHLPCSLFSPSLPLPSLLTHSSLYHLITYRHHHLYQHHEVHRSPRLLCPVPRHHGQRPGTCL